MIYGSVYINLNKINYNHSFTSDVVEGIYRMTRLVMNLRAGTIKQVHRDICTILLPDLNQLPRDIHQPIISHKMKISCHQLTFG